MIGEYRLPSVRPLAGGKWVEAEVRIRNWYCEIAESNPTKFDEGDRFWTPKYYSFEIYSDQKLEEKLDTRRLNPVRAGLVERAIDWKWSSARKYILNKTVGVPIQWPER